MGESSETALAYAVLGIYLVLTRKSCTLSIEPCVLRLLKLLSEQKLLLGDYLIIM